MLAIEGPFVECHLDEAAAQQYASHDEEAQAVNLAWRQCEPVTVTFQEEMYLQEPEGVAEAIPPKVQATNFPKDRIDAVYIGSKHGVQTERLIFEFDFRQVDARFGFVRRVVTHPQKPVVPN